MALIYNGTEPTAITYNGTSLNVLQYGSTTVWGKPFSLTTSAGANTTIGVNRISSPNQHASTGGLESGAKVYYGDVLQIDASADDGYTLSTFTVNGTAWTSGNTITVSSAITVVTSATQAQSWHTVWTGSAQCGQFTKRGGSSQTIYPIVDNNLVVGKTCRITGYHGTTSYPFTSATAPFTTGYSAQAITITDLSVVEISGDKNFRVIGSPSSTATGTYSYIYITKIEQYY